MGEEDDSLGATIIQQQPLSSEAATTVSNNITYLQYLNMKIIVVELPVECSGGTADVLRYLSNGGRIIVDDETSKEEDVDKDISSPPSLIPEQSSLIPEQSSSQIVVPSLIPCNSHVIVLPGDLILCGSESRNDNDTTPAVTTNTTTTNSKKQMSNVIGSLADAHRMSYPTSTTATTNHHNKRKIVPAVGMTVLLTQVGEVDDLGLPMKESTKAKRGGIAREVQDIEYIALGHSSPNVLITPTTTAQPRQVVLKQSKYALEEEVADVGETPKLVVPKARLHSHGVLPISNASSRITVRADWRDVHVYALSPWVLRLLQARPSIRDLRGELLPLLVSRQFRGLGSAFGCHSNGMVGVEGKRLAILEKVLSQDPFHRRPGYLSGGQDIPFTVMAQVVPHQTSRLTIRACTVPSYLYSCREIVSCVVLDQVEGRNITPDTGGTCAVKCGRSSTSTMFPSPFLCSNPYFSIPVPGGASIDSKFSSIVLLGSTIGDKVHMKSSTIGKQSRIGNRCRVNNVVVMDKVIVGDNCILQNSVLARGSTIGDNCKLNDCQVGPCATVLPGTKAKGESFMRCNVK